MAENTGEQQYPFMYEKGALQERFTSDGTHIDDLAAGYRPLGDMDDVDGFSAPLSADKGTVDRELNSLDDAPKGSSKDGFNPTLKEKQHRLFSGMPDLFEREIQPKDTYPKN